MKPPKGKLFGAILADPAIPFTTWSPKGESRTPQHHYRCPAFDKLAAIPVASWAAPNCFLFCWVPLRSVFLVEPLMNAWGFVFSGSAFAWAKLNPSGIGWASAPATPPGKTPRSVGWAVVASHTAIRRRCAN